MTRRTSTVTARGLRDASDAGLSGSTTPTERLALVDVLTREAWALAGRDVPAYARHETPVSVRPLRAARPPARP
jgi:hypothetical protein